MTFVLVPRSSTDPVAPSAPTPLPGALDQDDDAIATSMIDDELEVRVRLPARLVAGNTQQFHLEVTGVRGQPLDDDLLLEVRLHTDLVDRARGHLWVTPSELLTTPSTLRSRPLELGTTLALPCHVSPGSVRIEVRTLATRGPAGERSSTFPQRPCDLPSPPTAPRSVQIEAAVCGDRWREDLKALAAGRTPPARWCHPDPDDPVDLRAATAPTTAPPDQTSGTEDPEPAGPPEDPEPSATEPPPNTPEPPAETEAPQPEPDEPDEAPEPETDEPDDTAADEQETERSMAPPEGDEDDA